MRSEPHRSSAFQQQLRLVGEPGAAWIARLLTPARQPSLTREEFDRLQQWLACMRMLCDTPYILDAMIGGDEVEGPVLERAGFCAKRLRDDLLARYGEDLVLLETRRDETGTETVIAVIDGVPAAAANEALHLARVHAGMGEHPKFEVLDRSGYAMLQRLVEAGIVRFAADEVRQLHTRSGPMHPAPSANEGTAPELVS